MSTEKREGTGGIEFNRKGMLNLLIKLGVLAGWTGMVFVAADKFNFLEDGLAATDLLTLGMELGGGYLIGRSDELVK